MFYIAVFKACISMHYVVATVNYYDTIAIQIIACFLKHKDVMAFMFLANHISSRWKQKNMLELWALFE